MKVNLLSLGDEARVKKVIPLKDGGVRGGFLCGRTIYRERGRTTKPPPLLFHRCARTRESISILPGNLTSVKSHDINNSPSPSQPGSGRVPPFFFFFHVTWLSSSSTMQMFFNAHDRFSSPFSSFFSFFFFFTYNLHKKT